MKRICCIVLFFATLLILISCGGKQSDDALESKGNLCPSKMTVYADGVHDVIFNYDGNKVSCGLSENTVTFEFDDSENKVTISMPDNSPVSFYFDSGNRLIKAVNKGEWEYLFSYDENGNPTSISLNGEATDITVDKANRVLKIGGDECLYDANGYPVYGNIFYEYDENESPEKLYYKTSDSAKELGWKCYYPETPQVNDKVFLIYEFLRYWFTGYGGGHYMTVSCLTHQLSQS